MMSKSIEMLTRFIKDDDGQDLIEYAIVAGLIGVGAVVSMGNLDTKIKTAFNSIGTELSNAT